MAKTISELLTANLNEVFGERDKALRTAKIPEIFAPDAFLADPEGVVTGYEALNTKVQELLDGAPGFVFTVAGPVYEVQDLGVLSWELGPAGAPAVASGMDVATVKDGRIVSLHTILK